jgi:protein-arginine kinase activator protein McsA
MLAAIPFRGTFNEDELMLCARCNSKEATVHLSEFVDGKLQSTHLCKECYEGNEGATSQASRVDGAAELRDLLDNTIHEVNHDRIEMLVARIEQGQATAISMFSSSQTDNFRAQFKLFTAWAASPGAQGIEVIPLEAVLAGDHQRHLLIKIGSRDAQWRFSDAMRGGEISQLIARTLLPDEDDAIAPVSCYENFPQRGCSLVSSSTFDTLVDKIRGGAYRIVQPDSGQQPTPPPGGQPSEILAKKCEPEDLGAAARALPEVSNGIMRWPCPNCGRILRSSVANAGKKGRCAGCNASHMMPLLRDVSVGGPIERQRSQPAGPTSSTTLTDMCLLVPLDEDSNEMELVGGLVHRIVEVLEAASLGEFDGVVYSSLPRGGFGAIMSLRVHDPDATMQTLRPALNADSIGRKAYQGS